MAFDPYHAWLGIRFEEQPASHYRLLGLSLLESNPDVIDSAADRQMAHVRTFQSGRHAAEAQRLLNEISAARICLLDPQSRAAYEADFRRQLSIPRPPLVLQDSASFRPPPALQRQVTKLRPRKNPLAEVTKIAAGGLAGAVLAAILLRYVFLLDVTGLMPLPQRQKAAPLARELAPAETTGDHAQQPGQSPPIASSIESSRPAGGPIAADSQATAVGAEVQPANDTPHPLVAVLPAASERVQRLTASTLEHCVLLLTLEREQFFQDGGEEKLQDLSGREHHAVVSGPQSVAGKAGMGLRFDGVDDYLQCADAPDLNPPAMTICLWAQPTAWVHPSDAADYLVSKDDWKRGSRGFVLRFAAGGQPDFTIGVGRQWSEVRHAERQPLGQWVHLAATFDGKQKSLFMNGAPAASHPETRPITPSPFTLRIGRSQFAPKRGFQGVIDEVALFDVALPPQEIRQIYELGLAGALLEK